MDIDSRTLKWQYGPAQENKMIDPQAIQKLLAGRFDISTKKPDIEKLPGDASSRRYYRLRWQDENRCRSTILMDMAGSEGARTSEETGSTLPATEEDPPFITIQKHLFACKIPVPEIFAYDKNRGWILLEDLGNTTLSDRIEHLLQRPEQLLGYYEQAIEILIAIQLNASPRPAHPTIAHRRHFDQALLEWEFEHFLEYGIEQQSGLRLPPDKKSDIQSHFSKIAAQLAMLPQVFTHRDYHSRNLMIDAEATGFKIGVIDFQDALMGPAPYDLASLLRDSYVSLPEEMVDRLVAYYLSLHKKRSGTAIDKASFRESFDLMSIQRNLKAAGRFVFIDRVKKKNHLLRYISPTLANVKRNLLKYPNLKPLYDLLSEYVPELR
ncbi:MAG: aminoglycoside phosphotransferase family protein [Nitrospiria bacterium]